MATPPNPKTTNGQLRAFYRLGAPMIEDLQGDITHMRMCLARMQDIIDKNRIGKFRGYTKKGAPKPLTEADCVRLSRLAKVALKGACKSFKDFISNKEPWRNVERIDQLLEENKK